MHQKRCHPNQFPNSSKWTTIQSYSAEVLQSDDSLADPRDSMNDEIDLGLAVGSMSRGGENSTGEDGLRKKLKELKEMRDEMNRDIGQDIEILERALGVMNEEAS